MDDYLILKQLLNFTECQLRKYKEVSSYILEQVRCLVPASKDNTTITTTVPVILPVSFKYSVYFKEE